MEGGSTRTVSGPADGAHARSQLDAHHKHEGADHSSEANRGDESMHASSIDRVTSLQPNDSSFVRTASQVDEIERAKVDELSESESKGCSEVCASSQTAIVTLNAHEGERCSYLFSLSILILLVLFFHQLSSLLGLLLLEVFDEWMLRLDIMLRDPHGAWLNDVRPELRRGRVSRT
jgi:hypothetical protein